MEFKDAVSRQFVGAWRRHWAMSARALVSMSSRRRRRVRDARRALLARSQRPRVRALAKLANNENNGASPTRSCQAMEGAWKWPGRYGYPDPGIAQAIAAFDGVKPENVLITAGSGEVLDVVGTTFLLGGKKVLGVEPSIRLRLPARYDDQVRRHQAAADERLSAGYRHDHRRGEEASERVGVRVYVQPGPA